MKTSKPFTLPQIREVYRSNFVFEIKYLCGLLEKYTYIGMDTEFPGMVFSTNMYKYKDIKSNVNNLKLIQVGIALSDQYGNKPEDCAVWQFNLRFSLQTDKFLNQSINMLKESGIDFNELEKEGIPHELFAEHLTTSGLLFNEKLKWLCFHGIYDFAYLLHTLSNIPLPETEDDFFDQLKVYFPCFYDIRYLIRFNETLKGSLSRISKDIEVNRYGTQHQAGSDSLLTLDLFFKLCTEGYISDKSIDDERNCLSGISPNTPKNGNLYLTIGYKNVYKKSDSNTLTTQNSLNSNKGDYNCNHNYNYSQRNSVNKHYPVVQANNSHITNHIRTYPYYWNNGGSYYIQDNSYYTYNNESKFQIMSSKNKNDDRKTDKRRGKKTYEC